MILIFGFSLSVGEVIEYKAKFSFLTVGRMKLEVMGIEEVDGIPCYRVRMFAKGGALGINLYEDFQSWIDTSNFRTVKFYKRQKEPGWDYEVTILYRGNKAYYEGVKNGKPFKAVYDIPEGALDPVAIIYYTRIANFGKDDTLTVPYHVDGFSGYAKIFVKKSKKCSWKYEKDDECWIISPVVPLDQGKAKEVLSKGGEILFSSKRRLPVKIKVGLVVGSIIGTLERIYRKQ